MSRILPSRSSRWWKRAIWVLVTASLVGAMVAIYIYLRPFPPLLAQPVEIELEAGKRYTIGPLPLGGRYRLRACDHATELRVSVGEWSSGWVRLPVNPLDLPARDLRIDGRAGGTLVLEASTPTGRLLLLSEHSPVTCRGDDPADTAYSRRCTSQGVPPFDCGEETLSRYDREALELLGAELMARYGAPVDRSPLVHRFKKMRWYHPDRHFSRKNLPERIRDCLARIESLAPRAPAPGSLPFLKGDLEEEAASSSP